MLAVFWRALLRVLWGAGINVWVSSFDLEPPLLKRPLLDATADDEPDVKRQKSSEPPAARSIEDKVLANAYRQLKDFEDDVLIAIVQRLEDIESSEDEKRETIQAAIRQVLDFKKKSILLLRREEAYPEAPNGRVSDHVEDISGSAGTRSVLSLVGNAPQERRLFSSLQAAPDVDVSEIQLPAGVTLSRVAASSSQDRAPTLGELFAPPKSLPPLQPPKQPKTSAKGNQLDFYHPELTDKSQYRQNSYFSQKLSAGHYLDYSHATPSASAKEKKHERQQSLAGKKPSTAEVEVSEMEALFRGAFSSFAPCKDDSAAVVPSNIAGKLWWQQAGQQSFQHMIEVEYYDGEDEDGSDGVVEVDEKAIQEAIDKWDDHVVDPSLEDAMGTKRDDTEKEVDEILDEVSDMIETLASYQRIRNLNLPNSQNRQTSDPVNGDMLATAGPEVSEDEQATYQMLKAQLSLIVKTLPPYAVAKLNGDQLDDLLISTKVQITTDQYKGVMDEDDAAVQARLRAQQQAAQAQPRLPQRTPSISYGTQYHTPQQQYGTPTRPPSQQQNQFFRPNQTPNYQRPGHFPPPASGNRGTPQMNQYSRPNGFPSQYATQLAKQQTPFGHQNMQQGYNGQQQQQQRQYQPQQGTPNARYPQGYQQGYSQQQQQPGTPNQGYMNGGQGMQQRPSSHQSHMSPQMHRQAFSQSPNMDQQRFGTPNQGNRYSQQGGGTPQPQSQSLGYSTVIPEAQQQRILEQAKARVAAQERSAQFTDKISPQPGTSGLQGVGLGGRPQQVPAQRTPTPTGSVNGGQRQTPVPVPTMPGQQGQPPSR